MHARWSALCTQDGVNLLQHAVRELRKDLLQGAARQPQAGGPAAAGPTPVSQSQCLASTRASINSRTIQPNRASQQPFHSHPSHVRRPLCSPAPIGRLLLHLRLGRNTGAAPGSAQAAGGAKGLSGGTRGGARCRAPVDPRPRPAAAARPLPPALCPAPPVRLPAPCSAAAGRRCRSSAATAPPAWQPATTAPRRSLETCSALMATPPRPSTAPSSRERRQLSSSCTHADLAPAPYLACPACSCRCWRNCLPPYRAGPPPDGSSTDPSWCLIDTTRCPDGWTPVGTDSPDDNSITCRKKCVQEDLPARGGALELPAWQLPACLLPAAHNSASGGLPALLIAPSPS